MEANVSIYMGIAQGGRRDRSAVVEGLESRVHLSGTAVHAGGADTAPPQASRLVEYYMENPLTRAGNSFVFGVRYHDAQRVDTDSLDDRDVRVTGPRGFTALAHLLQQSRGKHGSTRTALYAVYGPNGRWSSDDNGAYALHLEAGEVSDLSGNGAPATDLGTVEVAIERRHGTRTLRQTTGPTLAARSLMTGIAVGTKVVLAGGHSDSLQGYSDVADVYDAATDSWSSGQRLGEARAGMAAVAVGNVALFAGGYTDAGPSDSVDIYDAAAGAWSVTTLPRAARDLGVATVGGKAIFIDSRGHAEDGAAAYVYDTLTRAWSTVALPPGCSLATAVGSKVLFPGSWYTTADGGRAVSDEVAIYDDAGGTWSTIRTPEPVSVWAVAAVGDEAVIVGGYRLNRYDVVTGRWSSIPSPITSSDVVTVGSRIVMSDGQNVEIYDVARCEWSRRYLLMGRESVSTGVLGNKVMFAGGSFRDFDGNGSATDLVDVYDGETGQWSITRMSQRRSAPVVVAAAGRMVIVGGQLADADGAPATDAADVLINGSAVAALVGRVAPEADGASAWVTITNSGDGALAGPFPVAVYASRQGRRSVLVGQAEVGSSLAAGAWAQVSVPLSIPEGIDLGRYGLVAAAGRGRRATAFATWTEAGVPTAALVDAPVVSRPVDSYVFSVRYESPNGFDPASLGSADLLVTGPDGYAADAYQLSIPSNENGGVVVRYELRDVWRKASGNGTYTVHLREDEVRDRAGYAAAGRRLGTFTVALPG